MIAFLLLPYQEPTNVLMVTCMLSRYFLLSGLGSHFDKCQLRDSRTLQRSQSAVPLPNPLMSSSAPKFRREAVTHRILLADGTKAQSPGIACIHAVLKQIHVDKLVLILYFK